MKESDILSNVLYICKYYQLNDVLHNRGFLTLASPKYVEQFQNYKKKFLNWYMIKFLKWKRAYQTKKINEIKNGNNDNISKTVEDMVILSASNVEHDALTNHDRKYLIYELVERTLNAKIGALVKDYRSKNCI